MVFFVDRQVLWAPNRVPATHIFTRGAEDLNPRVFPVTYEHSAIGVNPHAVEQVELPWALSRLPPGLDQLSCPGEAMDPSIAVAIRDVEIAIPG